MKVAQIVKTLFTDFGKLIAGSLQQRQFILPLLFVSTGVVLIETLVMDFIVYKLGLSDLAEILIDILLLTLMFFPLIYMLWRQTEERRRAETEVRKSQEVLERLFSISDILLAYVDLQFNFLRVNQAFALADGRSESAFSGKNYFDLYPDEDARKIFQAVVDTGVPYLIREKPVFFSNRPELGVSYWDWSLVPVKDIDGNAHGLILSLVDATRRRNALQELDERDHEIWLRNQILAGLNEISYAVNNTLDREEIVAILQHKLKDDFRLTDGAIYQYNPSSNTLSTQVVWGEHIHPVKDLPAVEFHSPQVIAAKQVAFIPAAREVKGEDLLSGSAAPQGGSPADARTATWRLAIPLVAQGQLQSVIEVYAEVPLKLLHEQMGVLETFGREAGAALYNAQLYQSEMHNRERLQALSRRLVEVQENERLRIVRELHDEIGQVLASLNLGLRLIEHHSGDPAAVTEHCRELSKITGGVQDSLHRLAMDLRPAALDHLGLVPALHQHAETACEQHGLKLQFEAVGILGRLPDEIEIAIYRIVQEALTNVLKHSNATCVDILLEQQSKQLVVVVEDNGIGFDPTESVNGNVNESATSSRLGILGMHERAKVLNGTLTIESTQGQGTTILVEIPYAHSNPDS